MSVTVSFLNNSPRYLSPSNLTIFKITLPLLSLPLSPGQKPHPGPVPPPPPPIFPQKKSTVGSSNLDTKQILHSPESRKQTQRPGKGRKQTHSLSKGGAGKQDHERKKMILSERERERERERKHQRELRDVRKRTKSAKEQRQKKQQQQQ